MTVNSPSGSTLHRLADFSEILRAEAIFPHYFGNGADTRVAQNVVLVFLIQFVLPA